MQVKKVAISSIGPDPKNARLHGDENLQAIRNSLVRYGQVEPVVVNTRTGLIVGGHGRVEVMRSLGWTEVNIVEVDLDAVEASALGIALNRSAEMAEWDPKVLGELIASVSVDPQLLEVTGFNEQQLAALLTVTKPRGDAKDDGGAWTGMPDYGDHGTAPPTLVISFRNEIHRLSFIEKVGLTINKRMAKTWSTWWPDKEIDDVSAVRFKDAK